MVLPLLLTCVFASALAQYHQHAGGQVSPQDGSSIYAGFPGGAYAGPFQIGAGRIPLSPQNYAVQQPQPQPQQQPAPQRASSPTTASPFPAIVLHKQALGQDGTFNFQYQADNGLQHGERIAPDGSRKGSYSYIGANGQPVTVRYTAGKDGFVAEGDHLPRQPIALSQPAQPTPSPYATQPRTPTTIAPAIRYSPQPQSARVLQGPVPSTAAPSLAAFGLGQGFEFDLGGSQPLYNFQLPIGGGTAAPLYSPQAVTPRTYRPEQPSLSNVSPTAATYSPHLTPGSRTAYNPQLSSSALAAYSPQLSSNTLAAYSPKLASNPLSAYSPQLSSGSGGTVYSPQLSFRSSPRGSNQQFYLGGDSSAGYNPQVQFEASNGAYSPRYFLSSSGADQNSLTAYSPQLSSALQSSGAQTSRGPQSFPGSAPTTRSPSPAYTSGRARPLSRPLTYSSSQTRPASSEDYEEPDNNRPHNFGQGYSFEFSG